MWTNLWQFGAMTTVTVAALPYIVVLMDRSTQGCYGFKGLKTEGFAETAIWGASSWSALHFLFLCMCSSVHIDDSERKLPSFIIKGKWGYIAMINYPEIALRKGAVSLINPFPVSFLRWKGQGTKYRTSTGSLWWLFQGRAKGAGCALWGAYYLGPTAAFQFHFLAWMPLSYLLI